jgi:hypothetical protein
MRCIKYKLSVLLAGLFLVSFNMTGCTNSVEAEPSNILSDQAISAEVLNDLPYEEIIPEEMDGLVFMREEEKLARDVYLTLYDNWGKHIFINISGSEQKHTDAIKYLLNKYEIPDPVEEDSIGVFENEILQDLYSTLIEQGRISLVEALKVGALIEEIDILDIQKELDEHVDNEDITMVYNNLLKGSRNHLRAFVKNLSRQGIEYVPLKLTEEQYLLVLNSTWERGRF